IAGCYIDKYDPYKGLPRYLRKEDVRINTPWCLNGNLSTKKYENIIIPCGMIEASIWQNASHHIELSDMDELRKGDYFIELYLPPQSNFNLKYGIYSIHKLSQVCREYPRVKWILGTSWLASVAEGRLMERLGFNVTDNLFPSILN
ncbi:MAG TPA: hypothetical protein VK338_02285, partial [Candidatus Nitrosocosmicus sp.]|nr:hypothetical protein [Candidatus Nitrosocosmicus sp.]